MKIQKLITLPMCVLALSVFIPTAFAQGGNAVLSGTVADPSGASVPGAHVTLTNIDTNLTMAAETNTSGLYRFPTVPPGHYLLAADMKGFQKF